MRIFDHLMDAAPTPDPIGSIEQWWQAHQQLASSFPASFELALAGGFGADRLGYAFASGYQAAGSRLFGAPENTGPAGAERSAAEQPAAEQSSAEQPSAEQLSGEHPTALCATEGGSAHPRDIKTSLRQTDDGWRLSGHKSFVTLGTFAQCLLVVASCGEHKGRNQLRVVRITPREGVTIEAMPPSPFVPEVPHATLTMQDVLVRDEELLAGDGYADYLKPFRTVEDAHVHAALLGWLLQTARRHHWPQLCERLLASAVTIASLCQADPKSPATHIALGGAMASIRMLLEELDERWKDSGDEAYSLWTRDRVLLKVAGRARAKRLEAAWRVLGLTARTDRPR